MSYPVRYYCPHCGAIVEVDREGYLSDKSVTPYPLVGWDYVGPNDDYESADGLRLVCGERPPESECIRWTGDQSTADDIENPDLERPCGQRFFLSFVRFEDGEEVEPRPETDHVTIATDESGPRRPSGPRGPNGPDGFGH